MLKLCLFKGKFHFYFLTSSGALLTDFFLSTSSLPDHFIDFI